MLFSQKFKIVKRRLKYKFKASVTSRLWYLYCSKKYRPLDCRNGDYSINGYQKCRCLPLFTEENVRNFIRIKEVVVINKN
uniref:Uncharacterized protein n=1 Tax=Strongyloides venezuelensis TaxID=75913 RepID=A0A0K0FFE6_STRVS